MGTDGFYGILHNGKLHRMQTQSDAHPDYLGRNLVKEVVWGNMETWKKALVGTDAARLVDQAVPITEADRTALRSSTVDARFLQMHSPADRNTWCVLTKKNHCSIVRMLQSGYLHGTVLEGPDAIASFPGDGFYSYLVDLDSNTFRFWNGKKEMVKHSYTLDAIPKTLFEEELTEEDDDTEEIPKKKLKGDSAQVP